MGQRSSIHERVWKEQSLKIVLQCLGCPIGIAVPALPWENIGLGQADGH